MGVSNHMNDQQIAEKICNVLEENGIYAAWNYIDLDEGKIELAFELKEGETE